MAWCKNNQHKITGMMTSNDLSGCNSGVANISGSVNISSLLHNRTSYVQFIPTACNPTVMWAILTRV